MSAGRAPGSNAPPTRSVTGPENPAAGGGRQCAGEPIQCAAILDRDDVGQPGPRLAIAGPATRRYRPTGSIWNAPDVLECRICGSPVRTTSRPSGLMAASTTSSVVCTDGGERLTLRGGGAWGDRRDDIAGLVQRIPEHEVNAAGPAEERVVYQPRNRSGFIGRRDRRLRGGEFEEVARVDGAIGGGRRHRLPQPVSSVKWRRTIRLSASRWTMISALPPIAAAPTGRMRCSPCSRVILRRSGIGPIFAASGFVGSVPSRAVLSSRRTSAGGRTPAVVCRFGHRLQRGGDSGNDRGCARRAGELLIGIRCRCPGRLDLRRRRQSSRHGCRTRSGASQVPVTGAGVGRAEPTTIAPENVGDSGRVCARNGNCVEIDAGRCRPVRSP